MLVAPSQSRLAAEAELSEAAVLAHSSHQRTRCARKSCCVRRRQHSVQDVPAHARAAGAELNTLLLLQQGRAPADGTQG